jgi:hypothetical protein
MSTCVYAMIFVEFALLLRTFPFFPLQLRQMRKPYASLGSICLLGFHDAFYDASLSRSSIHSQPCSCSLIFFALPCTSSSKLSGTMRFVFFVFFRHDAQQWPDGKMDAIWRWISLSHGWLFIHATRMVPAECACLVAATLPWMPWTILS